MRVILQSWLDIQCRMLPGIIQAIVLLNDQGSEHDDGCAFWPPSADDCADLVSVARAYLDQNHKPGRPVALFESVERPDRSLIAYPLCNLDNLTGVFVATFAKGHEVETDSWGKMLEWGSLWLQFARQFQLTNHSSDLLNLIRLITVCLQPRGLRHSAMSFVNQLAVHFGCSSVGLGLLKSREIKLYSLSNNARFEPQSQSVLALTAAMNEAVDQERILIFPPGDDGRSAPITRAHADLAREHEVGALMTIPLNSGDRLIGALTLERQHLPFDLETAKLCQFIAMAAGPILELKRENDRGPLSLLTDWIRRHWEKLFGTGQLQYKTAGILLVAALLLLTMVESDYRVSADAILEGRMQRVVVSPVDGYIASADVRPGDVVRQAAILGTLDDKDIKLEQLKWANQLQQHQREYREAMALHDPTKVSILSAQIGQAEAQIAMLNEKLAKITISAPFDSVVLDGDLSQSLGSPVSRGDMLFKLAPLTDYRLILNVDEKNFAEIMPGQTGKLVLSSLPRDNFPITIEKTTPVSVAKEGRNSFRVEAKLETGAGQESLRPGMKGIGKIEIGRRRISWILSHALLDWLRLWTWAHLP